MPYFVPLRLAAVVAIVAVLGYTVFAVYQHGRAVERAHWEQQVARDLAAATLKVQQRTAEVELLRAQQIAARQAAEKKYADMQADIDRKSAELVRLGKRLRDPGARAACGSSVPSAGGGAVVSDDAAAGAELSERATQFLLSMTERCDRAAAYAAAAHLWAQSLAHGK